MEITSRFNKFYHGAILNDLFKKSTVILFREWQDSRSTGAFKIHKYEDYNDTDDLKQLLKLLNLNYVVNEKGDDKISTKDIEVKDLLDHVEWVFKISAQNGIELQIVKDEWDKLVLQYNR